MLISYLKYSHRILTNSALCLVLIAVALTPTLVSSDEPEFFDIPYAYGEWNIGQRMDESVLRYCVDQRDSDWEVANEIANAIAGALMLEPKQYLVKRTFVVEDFTVLYGMLLEHCDIHMGFKLIPGGVIPNWVTMTRPYYETQYVFVAADTNINKLADLAPGGLIGATMGTSAHIRLVSYLRALPSEQRWPTYPFGTNDLALEALLKGTVDVALVWAPTLWAQQLKDPNYEKLHVIDPSPQLPTRLGVGAILLSDETFMRAAIDEAISALVSDGTIQKIIDTYGFPAKPGHGEN